MELVIQNFNEKSNQVEENVQQESVKPDNAIAGTVLKSVESLKALQDETAAVANEPTKEELGLQELRVLISTTLSGKMDEIRQSIQQKMLAQEENIVSKLKKLNLGSEEDKKKAKKK